ncbi:MAG: sporulation peptidase YabG [Clostridia bacterium]|nr:sporulation peptidase YabG [Clostridia bacterium]
MRKFRKGDIVGRISYNKDVIFEITNIIKTSNNKDIYILKGLTHRIEADSPAEDLEIIDKRIVNKKVKHIENQILERIEKYMRDEGYSVKTRRKFFDFSENNKRGFKKIYTGRILHLDGDKRYSNKSMKYYKSLGLDAIVKNIPENKQAKVIRMLLDRYNPDIIVITGHDGMIKKGTGFNDIYNYRNSRHFINTVYEARKWCEEKSKDIAIFAGACQSYYEAIMSAGANFASSPKRIMIDFIDPLIVAERIALTDNTRYLTIRDIEEELRDGRDGVDGIGSMGKKTIINSE